MRQKKKWLLFICSCILLVLFFVWFYFYVLVARVKTFSVGMNSSVSTFWYRDSNGEYYLFLSKDMDRSHLEISFETSYKDVILSCYDGDGHLLGDLLNFQEVDYFSNDMLILKAHHSNLRTSTYIVHVLQSDLVSLFIDVDGGDDSFSQIVSDKRHETFFKGHITIFDEDSTDSYSLQSIRGRGNSTWLRPKKPFQIKFKEDVSILGLKASKKYILLTNHWDGSLSRNYLWLNLAKDLGLEYSVDCHPADIYINGQYMGSYLITNKVEVSSNSIDLEDGFLFEITNTFLYDIMLSHGYKVLIKYPNLERLSEEKLLFVKKESTKYLNKIEKMLYDNSISLEDISSYIDLDSFVKYYWIQEFSLNYDTLRGSNYCYVKDNKLYMGPIWDMDDTLNRSYQYSSMKEDYIFHNQALQDRIEENWYQQLYQKEGFSDLVDSFFIEHVEDFERLLSRLNDYKNEIFSSASMNYARWNYQEMQSEQIREWIYDDYDFSSSVSLLEKNIQERLSYFYCKYSIDEENSCQ